MGAKKLSLEEETLNNNIEGYYDALRATGSQRKAELESVKDALLQISNDKLASPLSIADKHKYIGFTLNALGEKDEALIFLNLSTSSGYSELDVYRVMAQINLSQQNFGDALMNFNAEVKDHPRSSEAYNDRGVFYFKIGEFDKALKDFNQSIGKSLWHVKNEEAKVNDVPLAHRAEIRILEGDYESALSDVNSALRANPDSINYALIKSSLENVKGNEEASDDWLFSASQFYAKNPVDFYFRAQARMQVNEFEAAFDDIILAEDAMPKFVANLFMGDFYRLQGDKDSAELWYRSAIKSFAEKGTKFTSDYLIASRAADGLRKLNVPYEPKIPTQGVIGVKSLDDAMVQNFLRLNF